MVHSFRKRESLYQKGQHPYGRRSGEGEDYWRSIGSNVAYKMDHIRRNMVKRSKPVYCLSFDLELEGHVEMEIASCVPYTYSNLKNTMDSLSLPSLETVTCEYSVLCKSLAGIDVPLITINNPPLDQVDPHNFLILNARTHPGEASSSWVIDGLMRELTQSSEVLEQLQEHRIVLKIVPMLNS